MQKNDDKNNPSELLPAKIASRGKRLNRIFGPVAAGIIIDALDFATFGPLGLLTGIPAGCLAGYWMGRSLGLTKKGSLFCAAAAGIYCTIPFTEFLPLATLAGSYARFQESSGNKVCQK